MEAIELSSVEELRNCGPGIYVVPYGHFRYKVIIGKIDENASMNLDGYGIGRVKDDAVVSAYLNENPSDNTVNIIMGYEDGRNGYDGPKWQENAGNFMRDVSNTLNLKRDNSLLIGFSNSAERTVPFAADYAANNNASHFPVVIVESSCSPPTKLSDAQRQSLIDHDVTIFNVYQSHKQTRSLINPLHLQNYEGVHIVDVEVNIQNCNGDLHVLPFDAFVSSGGLKLGNGSYDFNNLPSRFTYMRNNSSYYNQTFDLSYRFIEHYVDANGNYVSREITANDANALLKQSIPSYHNPLSMNDGFVIQEVESPIKSKYQLLKSINTDTKIASKSGRSISSDYDYVSTTMNNIKNQVKASSFVDGTQNFGFRAGGGIASMIQEYVNMYYDIVGSLMNSLSMEADAVISYGQAYVDMEDDMKKGVANIGEIVETDNSSKYIGLGFSNPENTQTEQTTTATTAATSTTTGTTTTTSTTTTGTSSTGSTGSSYSGSSSSYSSGGSSSYSGGSSGGQSSSTQSTQTSTPSDGIIEVTPVKPTTEPVYTQPTPQVVPQYTQEVWSPPAPEVVPTPEVTPTVEDMAPVDLLTEEATPEGVTNIAGMPEVQEGPRIPTVSTVPTSPVPIEAGSSSRRGNPILPIAAGLSVAAAAGIGAKAYIDHKKNNEVSEEEFEDTEYSDDEDEYSTFQYKEESDPEFQELEEESYSARNTDEIIGA